MVAVDNRVADEGSKASESDLQEYRAYLQRAETRLSTLHRVAGAFISGAGLLTLLASLALPILALYLLIRDLILFYFTA